MPEVRVLVKYCKGCGLCVPACPKGALSLSKTVDGRGFCVVVVDHDIPCTGCCNCAQMCPDAALEIADAD